MPNPPLNEDLDLALLALQRPDDVVLGEEFGAESTSQDRRWIIDPIDGTKSFISGNPVWATLIALVIGDEVVLSVVSAPAMQQRWWASREAGAFTRNNSGQQRLSVSTTPDLVNAALIFSPRSQWAQRVHGSKPRLLTVTFTFTCRWLRERRKLPANPSFRYGISPR